MTVTSTQDHVVLVDADGRPTGELALRAEVHSTSTPRHLGFSCYVIGDDGRVLLTRRALTKRTWPGVWTNSLCGHPRLGESLPDAIARRAEDELGMALHSPRTALPDFHYVATDASGIVENEFCPVAVARCATAPDPRPEEVMDLRWVTPGELHQLVRTAPWTLSPWCAAQVPLLGAHLSASGTDR